MLSTPWKLFQKTGQNWHHGTLLKMSTLGLAEESFVEQGNSALGRTENKSSLVFEAEWVPLIAR
jgi:hypothetical protein